MKRTILSFVSMVLMMILILTFIFLGLAGADQLPVPFEKAKQIALSGTQSESNPNCFFWEKEMAIDSLTLSYLIVYCKSDNSIVLIKSGGPHAIVLSFNGKEYGKYMFSYGMVTDVQPLTKEQATDGALLFFRELVEHKLI